MITYVVCPCTNVQIHTPMSRDMYTHNLSSQYIHNCEMEYVTFNNTSNKDHFYFKNVCA